MLDTAGVLFRNVGRRAHFDERLGKHAVFRVNILRLLLPLGRERNISAFIDINETVAFKQFDRARHA